MSFMTAMVIGRRGSKAVFLSCLLARRRFELNGAVVDVVLVRDELADIQ
jgi:hypothetical protein